MGFNILVTGGAGYIGSHVIKLLGKSDYLTVVYDDLSTGYREAVLHGKLVVGDLSDKAALSDLFGAYKFDAILHFAASISALESIKDPLKYYMNNTGNTVMLLNECQKHKVPYFIYSSTAAVYGAPSISPVAENVPLKPINPYGASKMMAERIIKDSAKKSGMRYVILRYFNVAGADTETRIGQNTEETSHLIKRACQTAAGLRREISIFGADYDTPDGTCVRDYIHVEDLAYAHLLALEYLANKNDSIILNCGYGHGYSVKEVLDMVKQVTQTNFTVGNAGRRLGDAPTVIADNSLIKKTFNWRPNHDNLFDIIHTSWLWEKKMNGQVL
jgi:UDP-glucose 4-epimerase